MNEAALLAALPPARAAVAKRDIQPDVYRTLQLDLDTMKTLLAAAPPEFLGQIESVGLEITLPLPYGGFGRFLVVNSPIMEKGLAEKYPMLQTYAAQGIDDPAATARIDVTTRGFRAMVLSPRGQYCVDPYWRDEDRTYIAYYKRNLKRTGTFRCEVHGDGKLAVDGVQPQKPPHALRPTGSQLRTYRLAVSTNGEYSEKVCSPGAANVPGVLSAIITSVNRVSLVFERDLAIRLKLVANTDAAIFLDPDTDPYSGDTTALLGQVKTQIPAIIGNANYDVGHLFGGASNGGGLANSGVCNDTGNLKAGGVSAFVTPSQDPYDVSIVAHELGHQFNAEHTFNASSPSSCLDNRNAATAYEPGSGSTILSYAGVCSDESLAPNSDDYFHGNSYEEMDGYTATGLGTCAALTSTGNTPPSIGALTNRIIPANTPFQLTASATDANGDTLTYCWEEFDLGPAQDPTLQADNGESPLFRTYDPTLSPIRTFPSLAYILNNGNVPPAALGGYAVGELLPSTSRTMNFRVTVRDNRAGGGGTNWAEMSVQVVGTAGPFRITSHSSTSTIVAGTAFPVTWNVAGTTAAPINCSLVAIKYSTDGGLTFPVTLAGAANNDGSVNVTIPNVAQNATAQGRLRLESVGNIFFDVNAANFTVTTTNTAPTLSALTSVTVQRGSASATTVQVGTASDSNGNALSAALSNVPADITASAAMVGNNIMVTARASCATTTTTTSRTYPVSLTVTDSIGSTVAGTVNIVVQPNPAPTLGTYVGSNAPRNLGTTFSPSAGPLDSNGNLAAPAVSVLPTALPGGGTASVDAAGVVTLTPNASTTLGPLTIRVTVLDTCGAAFVSTFVANIVAQTVPSLSAGPPGAPSAETCLPPNSVIDPGETVTVSLPITNSLTAGNATTAALTGTLQTSGGVTPISGNPQVYGVIGVGATVSRSFTFHASGVCGGTITATLQLQDGATSYGPFTYVFDLGVPGVATGPLQDFDGVTAPALPAGWTSTVLSGSIAHWTTSTTSPQGGTNAVFATPVASQADLVLVSPVISIPARTNSVTFRHRWNFQNAGTTAFDGGVLEIKIGSGSFTDIVTAGGAFTAGGYGHTVSGAFGNPLAGRSCWSGSANTSYTTTTVRLPAAASGQNIQLRWRLGCDLGNVSTGTVWRIDTIDLTSPLFACVSCAPAFTSSAPASPATLGSPYTHTFTASGSPAPTFALQSGTLPPGLALSSGGVLSGTPTSAGTGVFPNITVRASNGNAPPADQTFDLGVRTLAANYLAGFGLGGPGLLTGDANQDGVFNLMAYGLGLNPTTSQVHLLPAAAIKSYAGTPYAYITFNRSSVATDLTYVVQASADLQSWSTLATSVGGAAPSGPGFVGETGSAPTFNVEVRDTVPANPATGLHRFIRLQVTTP